MWKKNKAKQQLENTLVLDPVKGFGFEHVENPPGRQWRYGKNLIHLVTRNNDALTPIELPPKIGETPEKLYRALFWEKEAEILFTLRNLWLEKLKLLGMYLLIGLLLFFIFLIFSSL